MVSGPWIDSVLVFSLHACRGGALTSLLGAKDAEKQEQN